jgi:hypothetical protein
VLTAILFGLTRLLRVAVWLGGPLVALVLVLHAGLVAAAHRSRARRRWR